MSRDVPFDHDANCDVCGTPGAYDFMGDHICAACSDVAGAASTMTASDTHKTRETALELFVRESNRIEGIIRNPTKAEIAATNEFVNIARVVTLDVVALVGVLQPNAQLRLFKGIDVRVGNHIAPSGGPHIGEALLALLERARTGDDPWHVHCDYETLHPFTDGNGRSGRALWLWQMVNQHGYELGLGFLHLFYYQTLARGRP